MEHEEFQLEPQRQERGLEVRTYLLEKEITQRDWHRILDKFQILK